MHEPAIILQPRKRVRYLKLIALFKIGKGVALSLFAFSLLFLNGRSAWMDRISDWIDAEVLLGHSKIIIFLLNKLQDVLAGGKLRAAAFLMLFYCAILLTEGVGVYMQKRWAEFLMIIATAALIPLEARHLWHHPGLVVLIVLLANCFIVWFLYWVLRRDSKHPHHKPARAWAETR